MPNAFSTNEERMYRGGEPSACPPLVARHEVITYRSLWERYMQADGTVSEQARGWDFDSIWNALSPVPDNTVQEVSDDEPDMEDDVLEDLVNHPESHRAHVSIGSLLNSISGGSAGASRMPCHRWIHSQKECLL